MGSPEQDPPTISSLEGVNDGPKKKEIIVRGGEKRG